ncbi:putative transcription factor bHLH family [Helianthus annuus]|uniref:transcription factor EAT1 n=1 Tax=Helianthus annuus TaxID=4232 RepID=UPI000B903170|nr:transcription factor EAT1 [Helianthus annuus]KAJ0510723.1 putative transcription factor bHLH family [Helianthus annuus]KAJ0871925.1 putative transcription factor bHLH family [Helianthus annuus]
MDQTPYDLFASEKHTRQQLNEKFHALRNLIPNPTKGTDLVSVLEDAIEYTYELKRTVKELAIILQRKESEIARMKKLKIEDGLTLDVKSISTMPNGGDDHDRQWYNGTLKYMCCFLIILMLFRIFIINIC